MADWGSDICVFQLLRYGLQGEGLVWLIGAMMSMCFSCYVMGYRVKADWGSDVCMFQLLRYGLQGEG